MLIFFKELIWAKSKRTQVATEGILNKEPYQKIQQKKNGDHT